jgi:hypothetical protein
MKEIGDSLPLGNLARKGDDRFIRRQVELPPYFQPAIGDAWHRKSVVHDRPRRRSEQWGCFGHLIHEGPGNENMPLGAELVEPIDGARIEEKPMVAHAGYPQAPSGFANHLASREIVGMDKVGALPLEKSHHSLAGTEITPEPPFVR